MGTPAEDLSATADRRPADLARLLLAVGLEPPRARARDQQADRAGGDLKRRVLDGLAALDPEPDALDSALEQVVRQVGAPTGPARALCALFLEEWRQAHATPAYWDWLLCEALTRSDGPNDRHGRSRGPS